MNETPTPMIATRVACFGVRFEVTPAGRAALEAPASEDTNDD